MGVEERQMVNSAERTVNPKPAPPLSLLGQAFHNLSLGLLIFDSKAEVVFCNRRYMDIYGLSAERVKPGTPVSELIQHRLSLGFRVLSSRTSTGGNTHGKPLFPDPTFLKSTN